MTKEFISPVDILSKVNKDGFSLSVFAVFDVLLIAIMFTMLSSKFILAPGFVMELGANMSLPVADSSKMGASLADESLNVLNLRGKNMIIFNGKIFNEENFARAMQNYKASGEVLLIKADVAVSGQVLINIASIANGIGFKRVLIAAEAK